MQRVAESKRLHTIEETWSQSIKDLFYQWHWDENLKHGEISNRAGISRPTVTRWFKILGIPSQPCTRFTNLNLLNVGPRKSPQAKPKIKKPRPWRVNAEFFNKWSADMAYVLGFFCADGCMFVNPRGSHYISFNITDKDLLEKIKDLLGSGHKLSRKKEGRKNWKPSWSIQIGSQEIFKKFLKLGITPKKARRLKLPKVPGDYLHDFIRGYFDGDGHVHFGYNHRNGRKTLTPALVTGFTSGSKGMLADVATRLHEFAEVRLKKPTFSSGAFRIQYSTNDSRKIYSFLYGRGSGLYLERKRVVFEKYLET